MKCEICEQRKSKLNRYGLCRECANAEDHSPIYDIGSDDIDRKGGKKIASHSLRDIIPVAEKGLDDETIEGMGNFYSGLGKWRE